MPNGKPNANGQSSSRYAGVARDPRSGALSIRQVDGETLRACIASVVDAGDAVLFGRTSDGGALSVRVLSNGATDIWYPTDASELQELLQGLTSVNTA